MRKDQFLKQWIASGSSYWTNHYPSDLVVDIISAAEIDLSWINHGSPTWSYTIIERSLNSYTWFEIGAVAPNVISYVDTDVAAYTTIYYYRIRYVKVLVSLDIPTLISATVEKESPYTVRLVYDGILDYVSVPATTDFTVTDHVINSVTVAGYTVTLILNTPVIYFDILKVNYIVPASNKLRIMNGGNAVALSNQSITHNIVEDGNTVMWFDSTDITTIIKNVSNQVSSWGDKLGVAANALLQNGADSIKPVWSATGVLFDGVNDFMKTAGTILLNQPTFLYAVINFKSFTANDFVFDGVANARGQMKNQQTGVALVSVSAGTETFGKDVVAADRRVIIRILFNGANSSIQINNNALWTGNLGTASMSGLTLARAGGSGTAYGHIEAQEFILRKSADGTVFNNSVMNYLKTKYSVTL
jgi:hypothetical protein